MHTIIQLSNSLTMPEQPNHADLFKPEIKNNQSSTFWSGLSGSSASLAIANLHNRTKSPILIITETSRAAEIIHAEINFFLVGDSKTTAILFPDWECLPYDQFSPHQEIVSARLSILSELADKKNLIIVVALPNLMQKLPPVNYISAHSFKLKVGDKIDAIEFRNKLDSSAYMSVSQVMVPGEYALRGGLIDVFPMGCKAPLRIDLFDNEVESLKFFDPQSQRTKESINQVELLPAREFPLNDAGVNQFRQGFRRAFEGDPKQQTIYNDVSNHYASPGVEFFFPLFFDHTACLFDFLPENILVIQTDGLYEQAQLVTAEIKDRYINACYDPERKVLAPHTLYLKPDELMQLINSQHKIVISHDKSKSGTLNFQSKPPTALDVDPKAASPYQALIDHLTNSQNINQLITLETPGRHEAFSSLLNQYEIEAVTVKSWQEFIQTRPPLAITISTMERGLLAPDSCVEIISETQLYGERSARNKKVSSQHDPEAIIRSLAELKIGDPVVHEHQGVGRYRGLQAISLDNNTTEFMVIEYLEQAKLYVPVLSLHLISRYSSGSAETAPWHRLGSDSWEKIKKKAKDKAYDVAVELLEVQALRESRKGYKFNIPQLEMDLFAASFDFEETPDQARAINEVAADLASEKPMDRLVCGDVGFGKTEVAIRAAFIAAYNSKQVAILVPTTLLAQQHYETLTNRFTGQALKIGLLSRFKSKKEIQVTLDGLASGEIDIVIGTHRLIQSDINFSRLGLLILDEEHRFGVRQKERLKQLRHEVDILTLTATPIPRTLNQTLSKIRDISIIATPPKDRLSVKTFVRERNSALIKEAISREVRRGGQVYVLHNDVKTIEMQASELQQLLPEITIRIGHGQMPEHQLEQVMQDFYHRRFNVFLCTTIVESGIDNPVANTIIINRADRFGLAQLHQLRGRVGRSHHQAYAYLLVDSFKAITKDAQKRLDAIASLEELGAGFALASHDLEIRGAGELLGEAQSGTIDQVGFSLYTQYLHQAIKSMGKHPNQISLNLQADNTEIDIHLPALLPQTFIPDVHMRLLFYKRLASAVDKEEIYELRVELADRFGLLPDAAKVLLELAQLKPQAQALGITRIDMNENGGLLEFIAQPNFDPIKLIQLIQSQPRIFQFKGDGKLIIKKIMPEKSDRLKMINGLLTQLSS